MVEIILVYNYSFSFEGIQSENAFQCSTEIQEFNETRKIQCNFNYALFDKNKYQLNIFFLSFFDLQCVFVLTNLLYLLGLDTLD